MGRDYKRELEATSRQSGIPMGFLDGVRKRNSIMTALDGWLEEHFEVLVGCAPPNSEYIIGAAEKNTGRQLSFGVHYVRTGNDASQIEKNIKFLVFTKFIQEQ
ncbi:hypothetical protein A3K73_04710 [Candidatus Pacearchaeota archaeon RBG_13_36_9]|nr:MAG: hypothetical protein A3K73_04710 [Candidatus Pacearchaeota archaeon RBG_13_36_9]